MKFIDLDQLDEIMEAAVAAVSVPGSVPFGVIGAARPNHITTWNDEEDARRFDDNLEAQLDRFEEAVGSERYRGGTPSMGGMKLHPKVLKGARDAMAPSRVSMRPAATELVPRDVFMVRLWLS